MHGEVDDNKGPTLTWCVERIGEEQGFYWGGLIFLFMELVTKGSWRKSHAHKVGLKGNVSAETYISPNPLRKYELATWPGASHFQDSWGVGGREEGHGVCHRPSVQVFPTPQYISYFLSEASFPFLSRSCHPIFPAGFFSWPGGL